MLPDTCRWRVSLTMEPGEIKWDRWILSCACANALEKRGECRPAGPIINRASSWRGSPFADCGTHAQEQTHGTNQLSAQYQRTEGLGEIIDLVVNCNKEIANVNLSGP
eukprot:2572214-Rhodomonas_salina.1